MTIIAIFNWICPECQTVMHDDIDDELGPFVTCTCDGCGKAFDQDAVQEID
jgi:hypothetical protein